MLLSHLTETCSLLSLLPGFMPSPTSQPLHRIGPYCLGSAIEYSIHCECWSSKLPCVKSIPLTPRGVVISLKMKLPFVSSPYSSTSVFSTAAWDHAVVRLYSGSLLDKSEKNAAEVLWYQVVRVSYKVSYKYISHAGLENSLNNIIFLFWYKYSGGGLHYSTGEKIASDFRENASLDLLITSVRVSQSVWGWSN